jgi:hypothetical protein
MSSQDIMSGPDIILIHKVIGTVPDAVDIAYSPLIVIIGILLHRDHLQSAR